MMRCKIQGLLSADAAVVVCTAVAVSVALAVGITKELIKIRQTVVTRVHWIGSSNGFVQGGGNPIHLV